MNKKPHRLKFRSPLKHEVEKEFNDELFRRVYNRIDHETAGAGMLEYFEYKFRYFERIRVEEKIKLLEEWEKKGRATLFNEEKIGELIYKKYELNRLK
jgi:hypothetical protein